MSILAARRQAEALVQRLGLSKPPVNVFSVAKALGITVVRTSLGNDISGLLITKPNGTTICVEEGDAEVRQRFTVAHEIGHYCLRHQFEPGEHVHVDRGALVSMRSPRSGEGTDQREVEANQFAACLLIPRAMMETAIERHGTVVSETMISELASKFRVSEQAMTIRLATLGYR
jgi:Zn-dependent peptidase ImmA (M78 family)